MENYIGIDFGTTNSVVCLLEGLTATPVRNSYEPLGDEPKLYKWLTPTVLAIDHDDHLFYGLNARKSNGQLLLSIKRILGKMNAEGQEESIIFGGRFYLPSQIAAYFFKLLKYNGEKTLGAKIENAVITIPSNSKGIQRFLTRYAAQKAGFNVVTLINEPTAAAMAYAMKMNYSEDDEKIFLVYDFGGGTFDVTLLRLTGGLFYEVGSKGIPKMGGDDLDNLLAQLIMRKTGISIPNDSDVYSHFKISCENAKIELSEKESVSFSFTWGEWNINCTITRHEFEQEIYPFISGTSESIDTVINDFRLENSYLRKANPAEFIHHVLLVGGTSKIPVIQRFVENHLGIKPESITETDPMLCVAQGAAYTNGIFHKKLPFDYHVKLEHSLCTYLIRRSGLPINSIRDSFNTILPFLTSDSFISNFNKFLLEARELFNKLITDTPVRQDLNKLIEMIEEHSLDDVKASGIIFICKFNPYILEYITSDDKRKSLIALIEKILEPGNMYKDIRLLFQVNETVHQLLNVFTEHVLDPLIKRGTSIPVDSLPIDISLDYAIIEGLSDSYYLPVYEGNDLEFPHHCDNVKLKSFIFSVPEDADRDTYRITMRYKYGEDGILFLERSETYQSKVTQKNISRPFPDEPLFVKGTETNYDLFVKAQKIIENHWKNSTPDPLMLELGHALIEDNAGKIEQVLKQWSENN